MYAVVREGGGLTSVRRRPAGNARPSADADLCVLVDAEPLASALAGARGRIGALHAALDDRACSPLAGAPGIWGLGHIDLGRYLSFPVESDEHFWVVARYVERNALRARLVLRAEEWRWSSLWRHVHGTAEDRSVLAGWPIERPSDWVERVNLTDDESELESLRQSVHRGRPFGRQEWQKPIAKRLGLESAYRLSGRPPKMGRFESGP